FDPCKFEDRYEDSLAELVKLKLQGKEIPKRAPAPREPTVNLLQALRESAAGSRPSGKTAAKKKTGRRAAAKAKPAAPRRKAS
ncbi:MAG TPA: Ku protein, partial [Roseiarcus sp.]